jgi:hypothetical protein
VAEFPASTGDLCFGSVAHQHHRLDLPTRDHRRHGGRELLGLVYGGQVVADHHAGGRRRGRLDAHDAQARRRVEPDEVGHQRQQIGRAVHRDGRGVLGLGEFVIIFLTCLPLPACREGTGAARSSRLTAGVPSVDRVSDGCRGSPTAVGGLGTGQGGLHGQDVDRRQVFGQP